MSVIWGLSSLLALTQAGEEKKPFKQTPNEVKVFELTNRERKKLDLPLLKLNPQLSQIARKHSDNMARQGKMEHKLDDQTHGARLRAGGYKFMISGENIAKADDIATLPMLMKAWMESEGHRKNIVSLDYTEIGVGIAHDKEDQVYYTQLFARPRK